MRQWIVGAVIALSAVTAQAGDLEPGRWLFLDLSKNERFSFELDFEPYLKFDKEKGLKTRTQKQYLETGSQYVGRRYAAKDGHSPALLTAILKGSISRGATFTLLLYDGSTFLSGNVSPDGKSMEGTFSDGSDFKAFHGGGRMRTIYRLCVHSTFTYRYECFSEARQQKTPWHSSSKEFCTKIPENYSATYFDKEECEAVAYKLNN